MQHIFDVVTFFILRIKYFAEKGHKCPFRVHFCLNESRFLSMNQFRPSEFLLVPPRPVSLDYRLRPLPMLGMVKFALQKKC